MTSIPYKQWVHEEAARRGRSISAIYQNVLRGHYPWLKRVHVNQHVVFVDVESQADWTGLGPWTEEIKP